MSYSGYDIEDAVVINKASLDRGFGRTLVYKKAECELVKYKNFTDVTDSREEPPDDCTGRYFKYSKLDKGDGVIKVGSVINSNEILVNKIVPVIEKSNDRYKHENIKIT